MSTAACALTVALGLSSSWETAESAVFRCLLPSAGSMSQIYNIQTANVERESQHTLRHQYHPSMLGTSAVEAKISAIWVHDCSLWHLQRNGLRISGVAALVIRELPENRPVGRLVSVWQQDVGHTNMFLPGDAVSLCAGPLRADQVLP